MSRRGSVDYKVPALIRAPEDQVVVRGSYSNFGIQLRDLAMTLPTRISQSPGS
jgi:hypothetical protein